jgi:hypothetical protein
LVDGDAHLSGAALFYHFLYELAKLSAISASMLRLPPELQLLRVWRPLNTQCLNVRFGKRGFLQEEDSVTVEGRQQEPKQNVFIAIPSCPNLLKRL